MLRRFCSCLIIFCLALICIVGSAGLGARSQDTIAHQSDPAPLNIYVFWKKGCAYCAAAKTDLDTLVASGATLKLKTLEVGVKTETDELYARVLSAFGYEQAAVPLVIIGESSFLGFYDGGTSSTAYREAVKACAGGICADTVAELTALSDLADVADGTAAKPQARSEPGAATLIRPTQLPDTLTLPILGKVETNSLSLPALTVLMAAIDGFNPCAMWVLVVLIGLLLGLEDEKRMWLLGGAFLLATGIMYFAVMAAWLNLILFLGTVIWVRIAVGALAIGAGFYFLREYWTKPEAVCRVTNPGRRQKIIAAFKQVVNANSLWLSVVSIMALAVLVNLIELLCSAGIPAVYTQVLVLSDLPTQTYYGYMLLYIMVFMIDDVAIFATAMFAMRVAGLTGAYARISHLIGGIVLLSIGAIMLLRPELLSFG